MKILVVDVGGPNVKLLATGQAQKRKFRSGKALTAARMVQGVKALTTDWDYDVVSVGFPGLVAHHGPRAEPKNLGGG
jgi:predicted NBD/HSP70 family sugar kinase